MSRLLAAAVLALTLLAACAGDADEAPTARQVTELQARVQQLEDQLSAPPAPLNRGPTLMVEPAIFSFPEGRISDPGLIWFFGSGLEPGQWIRISIEAEGEDGHVGFSRRRANESGAFALTPPEIQPDNWAVSDELGRRGGVFAVKLWDMETDNLLASTPLVVCGSDGTNRWCDAAERLTPAIAVTAAVVYELRRFQIEDDLFELRMGPESYWGYDADARIGAPGGDGLVITIKLGDTIRFGALRTSSSRSTKNHHFTITELGIDVELGPGDRIEPYELTPEIAGEFVIDDSSDPGAHGKVLLIVTE